MYVDQAGSDVESGDVDHLARRRRVDLLGDQCNLAAGNRDVAHTVDAILRIDHVPAFQQ